MTPSYRAAQTLIKRNDLPGLTSALDSGLSPNAANHNGWTLLMLAAVEGHVPLGQLLIARGADLAAMNLKGETAASIATARNHTGFVELLNQPI